MGIIWKSTWGKRLLVIYCLFLVLLLSRPLIGLQPKPLIECIPHGILIGVLLTNWMIDKWDWRARHPKLLLGSTILAEFTGFFLGLIYVDYRFPLFRGTTILTVLREIITDLF